MSDPSETTTACCSLQGTGQCGCDRDAAIVPRAPTEAMLIAARDWSYAKYGKPIGSDAAIGCWTAMLEAATDVRT